MKRLLFFCCLFCSLQSFAQEADSVYHNVDIPAEFPEGNGSVSTWLAKNIVCPDMSGGELTGKVYISFVVEKDGRLTEVRVRNANPELSRAIGGTVLSMPRWKPAMYNGQPVRTQQQLPLNVCFH